MKDSNNYYKPHHVFIGLDSQNLPIYFTTEEVEKTVSRMMKMRNDQEGKGLAFGELCKNFEKHRMLHIPKNALQRTINDADLTKRYKKEANQLFNIYMEELKNG